MNITLEQIDLLRERAHVSYEDAKEALENCNGSMVEALIYLEKQNKVKPKNKSISESNFVNSLIKLIKKGNKTDFIIKKKESTVLKLPVTLAILLGVITTPISILCIIAAILTRHKIELRKDNGEDLAVNKVFNQVSTTINSMTDNIKTNLDKKETSFTKAE